MVVAYIFPRDTLLQPGQIDARSLTRINYAFANIAGGRMVTGYRFDVENFAYLNGLKKDNPSLTVLVSVGMWLWSTNFSDAALTLPRRRILVQSVMDFLDQYRLDGLDIDRLSDSSKSVTQINYLFLVVSRHQHHREWSLVGTHSRVAENLQTCSQVRKGDLGLARQRIVFLHTHHQRVARNLLHYPGRPVN